MTSAAVKPGLLVYVKDEEKVWREGEVKTVFGPLCTVVAGDKVITKVTYCSKLQIRKGIEDNSKIFVLFLNKNIRCDPSLELSWLDCSNDGLQHTF